MSANVSVVRKADKSYSDPMLPFRHIADFENFLLMLRLHPAFRTFTAHAGWIDRPTAALRDKFLFKLRHAS